MKRRPVTQKAQTKAHRDHAWLVILAAVFVAYLPALNGGPLWDDFSHITVPELRSLEGLWRIWSEVGATQQYYPLLHSAFWLEHRLWGDSFVGYHLAGVALHSAAAFLLVLILRRLEVRGALFAGLIFALHPVCVESVAWISEQKNTLSAVFYLASAYVYLRYVEKAGLKASTTPGNAVMTDVVMHGPSCRPSGRPATGCHLRSLSAHCSAKTVTATLPAALLLVLWWQRGRLDWRRDVLPLVPWFAVAALAGAFTIWFEHDVIGARGGDFTLSFWRAAAPRRPCRLVLSRQAVLAPQSHLHLSAMGHRCVGVVAVSLSCRRRGVAMASDVGAASASRRLRDRRAGADRSWDICSSAERSFLSSGSSTCFRSFFPTSPIIFSIWRASASSFPLPAVLRLRLSVSECRSGASRRSAAEPSSSRWR